MGIPVGQKLYPLFEKSYKITYYGINRLFRSLENESEEGFIFITVMGLSAGY